MENFTPGASLMGGLIIGASALILLLFNGKVAGISNIYNGLLAPRTNELGWRASFIVGLITTGLVVGLIDPTLFAFTADRSVVAVIGAGVFVGFGTRLGGGCTSGHGICGLSQLSPRSIAATLTFMATGMLFAIFVGQVLGGAI